MECIYRILNATPVIEAVQNALESYLTNAPHALLVFLISDIIFYYYTMNFAFIFVGVNLVGTRCNNCDTSCMTCEGNTSGDCLNCFDGKFLEAGFCNRLFKKLNFIFNI